MYRRNAYLVAISGQLVQCNTSRTENMIDVLCF
jgi:hypothetical protein